MVFFVILPTDIKCLGIGILDCMFVQKMSVFIQKMSVFIQKMQSIFICDKYFEN